MVEWTGSQHQTIYSTGLKFHTFSKTLWFFFSVFTHFQRPGKCLNLNISSGVQMCRNPVTGPPLFSANITENNGAISLLLYRCLCSEEGDIKHFDNWNEWPVERSFDQCGQHQCFCSSGLQRPHCTQSEHVQDVTAKPLDIKFSVTIPDKQLLSFAKRALTTNGKIYYKLI